MSEPTIGQIKSQFSDALLTIAQLTKERDELKAQVEVLTRDSDRLAAKCEVLTNLARSAYGLIIEHHSSRQMREDLIECPCCVTKRGDEILNKLHAAYTNPTQCGDGRLSPEKAGRLREALRSMVTQLEQEEIRTNFPFTSKLISEIGRKALEDCK